MVTLVHHNSSRLFLSSQCQGEQVCGSQDGVENERRNSLRGPEDSLHDDCILILIHASTGSRPSSSTQCSKGTSKNKEIEGNEKLRYGDINLVTDTDEHGRTHFLPDVTFAHFKSGNRRPQRRSKLCDLANRKADKNGPSKQRTDNVSLKRLKGLAVKAGYKGDHDVTEVSQEARNQMAKQLESRTYRNHHQDQRIGLDNASLTQGEEFEDLKWHGLSEGLRDTYRTTSRATRSDPSKQGLERIDGLAPTEYEQLQCLFCLGNERLLPPHRPRAPKNCYELGRHVETHLKKVDKAQRIVYPHLCCKVAGITLNGSCEVAFQQGRKGASASGKPKGCP
nr:hypothetical protein CFP56_31742 [Quercus suber]